nr:MAG TPA: hypothetical protein [Caudoviricetes sp.]
MWEGVIIRPGIFKLMGVILLEGGGSLNLTYLIFC